MTPYILLDWTKTCNLRERGGDRWGCYQLSDLLKPFFFPSFSNDLVPFCSDLNDFVYVAISSSIEFFWSGLAFFLKKMLLEASDFVYVYQYSREFFMKRRQIRTKIVINAKQKIIMIIKLYDQFKGFVDNT